MIYPHPLDYVAGLKYCLTSLRLSGEFTISPSTFIVRELIDENLLINPANSSKGDYIVIRVVKKGVDTLEALRILSRRLGIPQGNIYFHGLKDRNATTVSHFYVKRLLVDEGVFPIEEDGISFEILGYISGKPSKSMFQGNEFEVVLGDLSDSDVLVLKRIMWLAEMHGIPSYYGYQRFGVKRHNTHLLGKLLLVHREDSFSEHFLNTIYPREDLEAALKRLKGDYSTLYYEKLYIGSRYSGLGLKKTAEALRSLFIDAYSSYLYNLLLNEVVERNGYNSLDKEYPAPGCSSAVELYRGVFSREGIPYSVADHMPCYYRRGLFRPLNTRIYSSHGGYRVVFVLKPGLYGSIVLRELFKDGLRLY